MASILQTSTSPSITITFDLPTAAVAAFVIMLLGLAAGLLLLPRRNKIARSDA